MNKLKVLITGCAGFIGMHTSIRFLNEGWDVLGIDSLNDYYSVDLKENRIREIEKCASRSDSDFMFHRSDINNFDFKSLPKIDAVVHLAAQAGVRFSIENPEVYVQSNISAFLKVLEYVNRAKIDRFVYASSSSVYGKNSTQPFKETEECTQPQSFYAATKRCNELMAFSFFQNHAVSSIGLRFFTVYGPWGRPDMAPMIFAEAAYSQKSIKVFNNGKQERDFTYIDDIVEGIYLITLKANKLTGAELFNIGNGSPVGLMEFIGAIEHFTTRSLVKEFFPEQNGDVKVTYADTGKLKKLINYKPETSLPEGIEKFITWFKEYNNVE